MILLSLLVSGGAFAAPNGKDFVLRGKTSNYVVDAQTFRPGYTAGLLFSGQALGKVVASASARSSEKVSVSLSQQLTQVTKDLNSGRPYAKSATQLDVDDPTEAPKQDAPPTVDAQAEAVVEPAAVADLDSCLVTALNQMKQRRQATRASGAADEMANYLTYRLAQTQTAGGLPCARGVAWLDTVVVADEVDAIKILTALRARRGDERARLVQAAHLAFTPAENPARTYAWREIWRRLAVAAAFESGALPSWADVLRDVNAVSPRTTVKIDEDFRDVRIKTNAVDVRAEMIEGLRHLGASYDGI